MPLSVPVTDRTTSDVAVTGACIYNSLSNTLGVDDVVVLNEGSSFDSSDGHDDSICSYHYHEAIGCASDGTFSSVYLSYSSIHSRLFT